MASKERLRLVVDTNVWLSYFINEQRSPLHSLLLSELFEIITSADLNREIFEVATRKKFSKLFNQALIPFYKDFFNQFTSQIKVTSKVSVCRDDKDNFLLALAKDGNADYLITGDDDLLVLKRFETIQILKLTDFIREFT